MKLEDCSWLIPTLYNEEIYKRLQDLRECERMESWRNLWLWILDILDQHALVLFGGNTMEVQLPEHYLNSSESLQITDALFKNMFGHSSIYQRMLNFKTKMVFESEVHFLTWLLDTVFTARSGDILDADNNDVESKTDGAFNSVNEYDMGIDVIDADTATNSDEPDIKECFETLNSGSELLEVADMNTYPNNAPGTFDENETMSNDGVQYTETSEPQSPGDEGGVELPTADATPCDTEQQGKSSEGAVVHVKQEQATVDAEVTDGYKCQDEATPHPENISPTSDIVEGNKNTRSSRLSVRKLSKLQKKKKRNVKSPSAKIRSPLVKKVAAVSKGAASTSLTKPIQLWKDKSIGVSTALWCQLSAEPESGSEYIYKLVGLVDKKKPYICGECGRCVSSRHDIHQHFIRRHKPLQFQCSQCEKRFPYEYILKRHVERDHGEEVRTRVECRVCGKDYKGETGLRIHMMQHSEDYNPMQYKCDICTDRYFGTKAQLRIHNKRHQKRVGQEHVVYACKMCRKTFVSMDGLKDHIKRCHSGNTVAYKCDYCDKVYKDKRSHQLHVDYTHLGKCGHLCDTCGATFSKKSMLNIHVKTHKERSVPCEVCGKMFLHVGTMLTHKQLVHERRGRHTCSLCFKPFSSKVGLASHMNSHTGERPFECGVCQKRFTQRCSMLAHVRKVHGGVETGGLAGQQQGNPNPPNTHSNHNPHPNPPAGAAAIGILTTAPQAALATASDMPSTFPALPPQPQPPVFIPLQWND